MPRLFERLTGLAPAAPNDDPWGQNEYLIYAGEDGGDDVYRVGGCKPRRYSAGAIFPLVPESGAGVSAEPDAIELVPQSEWATQESRRVYQRRTMDQNGYPACSLASLCNAMELLMAIKFGVVFLLDWLKAWKHLSGGRGGVALDVAAEYAAETGIPRVDGQGVVKIAEAYDCHDAKSLASAAMRGCIGTFAHDVHAECWTRIVLDDRGDVLLDTLNSWGDWGEAGPNGFRGWHLFRLFSAEISRYGVIAIRTLTGNGLTHGKDAQ